MKRRRDKREANVNESVEAAEPRSAEAEAPDSGEAAAAGAAEQPLETEAEIPEAAVSDAEDGEGLTPEQEALEALEQERDDLKDQLLRARAEFDNYRKRMARESDQLRKTAAQGLMRGLLPIVDNLERALSHVEDKSDGFTQGVEMIVKQFADVLAGQGLEPIPSVGERFDPNIHEALTHQPSNQYPADHVMEEFQRGYRLGEFVLRPSQVVVSSGAPAPAPEPDGDTAPDGSKEA